jgi:hypothetical protein
MIGTVGHEVLVPFTRTQLPSICSVPVDKPLAFDGRIARFDAHLRERWEKPAPRTSLPGATTLNAQLVTMAAVDDRLLIRGLDENGEERWRARVATEGSVFPLAAVRLGDEVVAIGNWEDVVTTGKSRQHVLLVFIKAPRASK